MAGHTPVGRNFFLDGRREDLFDIDGFLDFHARAGREAREKPKGTPSGRSAALTAPPATREISPG